VGRGGAGSSGGRPSSGPAEEAASPPRIIGGSLRGRRLPHVPGGPTRPMKERVREILFHLIGPGVEGTIAIDLFAGTGALGFESLSRGALRAIFAERHFPTADGLRRSAAELGLAERAEVLAGDVLLWPRRMPSLAREAEATRPWCVFVSPPWSLFERAAAGYRPLLELIATIHRLAPPGSLIAVESDEGFDPGDLPDPGGWRHRVVLPAVLHLLSVRPPGGES